MEAEKSAALLEGILETLKSINTGLESQEKRWQWLEARLGESGAQKEPLEDDRIQSNKGLDEDLPADKREDSLPVDDERESDWGTIDTWQSQSFVEKSKLPPLEDGEVESLLSSDGVGSVRTQTTPRVDSDIQSRNEITNITSRSSNLSVEVRPASPINSLKQLQRSFAWQIETKGKKVSLIEYRDWRSPLVESPLLHKALVQKVLGDAWMIPEDGRLPLLFSREYLESLSDSELEKQLPVLAAFRDKMKTNAFTDFKIVDDYRPSSGRKGGRATYRLGEPINIRSKIRVPIANHTPKPPSLHHRPPLKKTRYLNAPWRRLIFCQGLNTAELSHEDFGLNENERPNRDAPFLSNKVGSKGWRYYFMSLASHRRCDRLMFSLNHREEVNHYDEGTTGFHITFFEILPSYMSKHPKYKERGRWSQGKLYDQTEEDRLCESAFTMIEIPGDRPETYMPRSYAYDGHFSKPADTWTIMVLSPPLFTSRLLSTPVAMDECMHSMALAILVHCLRGVRDRWNELRDHLEKLLDEGDALFNPDDHDRLLWDDETFTRSRKYFWAIHCLMELHLSISDNIMQWENYHKARIEPLHKANALTDSDLGKLRELEEIYAALKNLRLYFLEKLTSTKALRDGLFNASAVVESRASTRLGENVKLLTLVSIFFLPLAFCTSLWSINNMFSTTTLIYTIIIIGFSTYLIVFNLNNLVLQASKSYETLRDRLIKKMKESKDHDDGVGFWKYKGERFDVFRPKHEKAHPSEWWIIVFVLHLILKRFAFIIHPQRMKKASNEEGEKGSAISVYSSSSETDGSSISRSRRFSNSSVSGDSVNSQIQGDNEDSVENRPRASHHNDRPEQDAGSTTLDNQAPKNANKNPTSSPPFPPPAILRPHLNLPSRCIDDQTEASAKPAKEAETPLSSPKRRDVAVKALSKIFRRKKTTTAVDQGIV